MKNTTLGQLAPCMVAAMFAFAAGSVSGQENVGRTIEDPIVATPQDDFVSEVIDAVPLESAPMATSPANPAPITSAPITSGPIGSTPNTSAPIETGTYVGDMPTCDGACPQGGARGHAGCLGCIGGCFGCRGHGPEVSVLVPRRYGRPDLFYNYYTQGYANQANAQMYLSPLPVPPNVGHTFFTYQPFYPEEYLYWHKNRFHRYYDNGRGMNRTCAKYYSPPVRQAFCNLYWNYLRIPR